MITSRDLRSKMTGFTQSAKVLLNPICIIWLGIDTVLCGDYGLHVFVCLGVSALSTCCVWSESMMTEFNETCAKRLPSWK